EDMGLIIGIDLTMLLGLITYMCFIIYTHIITAMGITLGIITALGISMGIIMAMGIANMNHRL
ncbi:hypothetical protein QTP86_021579, partial [Hemibagrus guttatus]